MLDYVVNEIEECEKSKDKIVMGKTNDFTTYHLNEKAFKEILFRSIDVRSKLKFDINLAKTLKEILDKFRETSTNSGGV